MTMCIADAASQAVGVEADLIHHKDAEIRREYIEAPLTGASFRRALMGLNQALEDASSPNWDRYGAVPVNRIAANHALRLLAHVPPEFPPAEVAVDPDGEVSIEWYREPRQVFSVSVSPSGRLSFAGTFGKNSVYGNEEFGDDYLPIAIRANLRRLFGDGS